MLEDVAGSLPSTEFSEEPTIEEFAESLSNNPCLFGDEATTALFKNFTVNSKLHELKKEKIEERFFFVLSKHPSFQFLSEIIDDPEVKGERVRRFYVAIRGVKTLTKKKLLNFSLILFSQSFIKVDYQGEDLTDPYIFAQAQYEPNTVDMNLRCLFGVFSSKSVAYSKGQDFKQRGDFPAYWKNVFELARKLRPDYGTNRKASSFDPDFRQKRRNAIANGTFQPLTNYTHHTWMLLEEIMSVNMLRGAQEPSMLCVDDFIHGIMPSTSIYAGRRFYRIRPDHAGQKGNPISLNNQSAANARNNHAYVPMIEPEHPDPLALYTMLRRHLTEYLPTHFEHHHPNNKRIFRRMASQKQLTVCVVRFNDNVFELSSVD